MEQELLNPKLDIVFQSLFGEEGSERITKTFLEKILDIKIQKIELDKNPILRREEKDGKLGVLDVVAKINKDNNVDIEMQIEENINIIDRILYYWSRLYVRSIKKGEDYIKLEKCIVILISNKKIEGFEELKCHTEWRIYETKFRKKILTDKFEIHIIELEKLKNDIDNISEELLDWLSFLQDPKFKKGMEKMEDKKVSKSIWENLEAIEEARQKLIELSEDPQMQQLAWLREKGIYEENGRKRREKEIKEGEQRLQEGKQRLQEGEQRLQEGEQRLQEGEQRLQEKEKKLQEEEKRLQEEENKLNEKTKQIAKGMLKLGVSKEEIIETTGLTKEELENL